MNCLELIVPLAKSGDNVVEDLCDAGLDKLLVRHALEANHEKLPAFYQAIKIVCPKADLQINVQLLSQLVTTVFECFGSTVLAKRELY